MHTFVQNDIQYVLYSSHDMAVQRCGRRRATKFFPRKCIFWTWAACVCGCDFCVHPETLKESASDTKILNVPRSCANMEKFTLKTKLKYNKDNTINGKSNEMGEESDGGQKKRRIKMKRTWRQWDDNVLNIHSINNGWRRKHFVYAVAHCHTIHVSHFILLLSILIPYLTQDTRANSAHFSVVDVAVSLALSLFSSWQWNSLILRPP